MLLLYTSAPSLNKSSNNWNIKQGPYSQHFIFYATFQWAQKGRPLHYTRLERLARDQHSILLDPFVSYKENEVLCI
jgi:hypothetical protein